MSFRPQYLETPPTMEDGQFNSGLVNSVGALLVAMSDPTVVGSPSDAAWSGTGDATVISLLKAIALNTTPTP